jgi:hypothetical protein
VQWIDEPWPTRAHEVILTLWDLVAQYMEMENRHMVDKMPEQPLKNEAKDLNEALEAKKEGWEREKQELVREKEQLKVRWRFSQSCCSALQAIVKNELDDKKMVWIVVICMIGALVAILFGVVLKLKSV